MSKQTGEVNIVPFYPIFKNLGIVLRHLCPRTHQQYDKAERKHLRIVETGLSLLAQAQMPLLFWWDAFVSSVFIINRLPTPLLSYKPLEARVIVR